MTYEDFIYNLYKEFGFEHYNLTPEQNARFKVLYDNDESAMLTAALWANCLDFELYQLEPWIASWFYRKKSIETMEQDKQLTLYGD